MPLTIIESPYRDFGLPLIKYIKHRREEHGSEVVTVYMPQYIVGHWWENMLHNHRARRIRQQLMLCHGVTVALVPWLLDSSSLIYGRRSRPLPGQDRRGEPIRPVARRPLEPASTSLRVAAGDDVGRGGVGCGEGGCERGGEEQCCGGEVECGRGEEERGCGEGCRRRAGSCRARHCSVEAAEAEAAGAREALSGAAGRGARASRTGSARAHAVQTSAGSRRPCTGCERAPGTSAGTQPH